MKITPTSTLYLFSNVDLDPQYNYTIDFENLEKQEAYFDSKISQALEINDEYSYIRDKDELRVQSHIDDLFGVNYLAFYNKGKRYYAFITSKRYVSETCTALSIKIDVMQSFMFDYTIEESFIDREHQDRFSGVEGDNLIPQYNIEAENLDAGTDYDVSPSVDVKDNNNAPKGLVWVEIVATEPVVAGDYGNTRPETYKNRCTYLRQRGVDTHIYCYLCPRLLNDFDAKFYSYDGEGKIKEINVIDNEARVAPSTAVLAIRVLHYCPIKYNIEAYNNGWLITFPNGYKAGDNTPDITDMRVVTIDNNNFGGMNLSGSGDLIFNLARIKDTNENTEMATPLDLATFKKSNLDISKPKNKDMETKLFTYPYQYTQLCDYQSNPLKIKNEFLRQGQKIKVVQSFGIQTKMKIYVDNYNNDNGKEYNTINSTISELPLTNNAYISYMAQNKASATTGVAVNMVGGLATLGLGLATGGIGLVAGAGMAINQGMQIANHLIKMQDLKDTPDSIRQAGNNAEFDLMDENFIVKMRKFKIKAPYYDKIFNYFFHYGYKANIFEKPNVKSRYYFNYIKTIGANIKTNIDADVKQEIASIYDNGITLWHYRDEATFKGVNNYNYENMEMSLL